jgi:hypothetical protein
MLVLSALTLEVLPGNGVSDAVTEPACALQPDKAEK